MIHTASNISTPITLHQKPLRRLHEYGVLLLFFVLACFQGYEFGTGDQALYVPLVLHLHDQTLFSSDLLIHSLITYCVPFWHGVAWLLNFGSAQTLFFLLFLVQTAVIIAGARYFYFRLFGDNSGWIVFLLMLVLTRSSGAMNSFGLNPFGYFQPCGLAFGMVFFAYGLLDAGRWKTAGIIVGSMFLYHPITAVWASFLFFLRAVIDGSPLFSRNKIIAGLMLILSGSPYFFVYISNAVSHAPGVFNTTLWIELAKMRLNHAFFISRWVPDRFVQFGCMLCGIVAFRNHPAFKRTLPIPVAALLALAAVALGEVFACRTVLQLDLARCTYFAYVLLFAFVASRISTVGPARGKVKNSLWVLASFLLMIWPLLEHRLGCIGFLLIGISLTCATMALVGNSRYLNKIVLMNGFLLVIVISGNALYIRHRDTGGCFTTASRGPWHELQVWVRNNIPMDQTLVTPVYLEGFRSYSLHASYGDYKDGGSHLFCPATIFSWWDRMQTLGLALNMKSPQFPKAYHHHAIDAARKKGIGYVVYDKTYAMSTVPFLYENERFGLVAVSDSALLVCQ